MDPRLTAEGVERITWLLWLVGIPCVLLVFGSIVAVVVMLSHRKK